MTNEREGGHTPTEADQRLPEVEKARELGLERCERGMRRLQPRLDAIKAEPSAIDLLLRDRDRC